MATTLKTLQRRKKEIKEELDLIRTKKGELSKTEKEKQIQLSYIENQIKNMKKGFSITEHALLRYVERIEGIDMGAIRKKILTEELKQQIETLGNGTYPIGKTGARAKVRDNAIVTIEAIK